MLPEASRPWRAVDHVARPDEVIAAQILVAFASPQGMLSEAIMAPGKLLSSWARSKLWLRRYSARAVAGRMRLWR